MNNSLAAERKNGPSYSGNDQEPLNHEIDTDNWIGKHM